jgi:release factor glutamine methyltransferase
MNSGFQINNNLEAGFFYLGNRLPTTANRYRFFEMRRFIKGIVNRTWKPYVQWYLKKTRVYSFKNYSVSIEPGVFHPGFFFSTKFLISFIETLDLKGKSFLEMGSGSGLVSIAAAKKNALVLACDVSPKAVSNTRKNFESNNVKAECISSDLFDSIPARQFDFIVVNPPYFKKNPDSIEEKAWYCGESLEYFEKFFQQAKSFVHSSSRIIMVLSDECDIHGIQAIAEKFHWQFELAIQKRTAWETGFIFNICPLKHEIQ